MHGSVHGDRATQRLARNRKACLEVSTLMSRTDTALPRSIGAVQLTPPATMVAALIGVAAGGVIGGMLAIPLLGASKAIYLALRTPELEVVAAGWVPPSDELPSAEPD